MTPSAKIFASLGSALLLAGGAAAYTLLDDQALAASDSVACIDPSGRIVWVEGACPSGAKQVPNACDSGCCEPCPPEGCPPETVEALMCCPEICGEGSECFPIVETTGECPPGSVLYECDYGSTNADGSSTCYIPPGS